ncbi:MAG: hypothetical protein JXA03_00640 [Bacteroidales bacterium]|nr:hypothetical protein [Bacteroidales bacterium]
MHTGLNTVIVCVLLSFLGISCKKEVADRHPAVIFLSPSEGRLIDLAVDTSVFVKAVISDDNNITLIDVSIVDKDFNGVMPSYQFNPNTAEYTLGFEYLIEGAGIEGGDYYIGIRAEDGTNIKRAYRSIEIKALQSEPDALIILSGGQDHIVIDRFNPLLERENTFTVVSDYAASAISPSGNILYIAGRYLSNLTALNITTGEAIWDIPEMINPPNHNRNCLYINGDIFVSFYNEFIRGYNEQGGITTASPLYPGEHAGNIVFQDNLILAVIDDPAAGTSSLITFHYGAGTRKQSLPVQFDVIKLIPSGDRDVIIIGNTKNENKGTLKIFNVFTGILTSCADMEAEAMAASAYGANKIFISSENGLYLLDVEYNSLDLIKETGDYQVLNYEPWLDALFAVRGNSIEALDIPSMDIIKTMSFSEQVLNIHSAYSPKKQ